MRWGTVVYLLWKVCNVLGGIWLKSIPTIFTLSKFGYSFNDILNFMDQKEKIFNNKSVDLVKDFYDQDIDHKALEKALTQRKKTAKGFKNLSLDPYSGVFGDAQKKHLLNRTMVGIN